MLSRSYLISCTLLTILITITLASPAPAEIDVIRRDIEPRVKARVKHGRNVGIEVRPPAGQAAQAFLRKYLALPGEWTAYKNRLSVFIPLDRLKPNVRRDVLLLVYGDDTVDGRGWHHTVVDDRETLWSLCEWLTGRGTNYRKVMAAAPNDLTSAALGKGQQILIPASLLSDEMKRFTVPRIFEPGAKLASLGTGLQYAADSKGQYAIYRLRKGEALFTSVVVRFTDFSDNRDILSAANAIAARSGIRDVRDIDAGQKVYIPLYMLSDRYLPKGSAGREAYEATIREAAKLRTTRAQSVDLSDVVVILDPGHGGTDPGAEHRRAGLYEDEINYDIACRIRAILKRETRAKVYMTVYDRSSKYAPSNTKRFRHDEDEELTTHPPYKNDGKASISANLRWMLVNSIYDKEIRRGIDPRKIIFTSIHTDSIFNSSVRGTMIYIPSAKLRRGEEVRTDAVYARYSEGREFNRFSSDYAELRRDEALSRNFAAILLDELGKKRIKRHGPGDPIRSQIRRSKSYSFVPAVLRNTKVPTKILVETANLMNSVDRKRLADPWWREQFAKAYVDALRRYYKTDSQTRTARAD